MCLQPIATVLVRQVILVMVCRVNSANDFILGRAQVVFPVLAPTHDPCAALHLAALLPGFFEGFEWRVGVDALGAKLLSTMYRAFLDW
jgi:hypothetical protein